MFPVATMCRVLKVSPSGFYAWRQRGLSARAVRDVTLTAHITRFHTRSDGTYGAPRILRDLRDIHERVGQKRVARLLRDAGLRGVSRRRWITTTDRGPVAQAVPDLVQREFVAAAPNQLWVADITCVPTWAGFLFQAVVLDAFSRRIVGWAMATHLRTELVLSALEMARVQRRPTGVIHHSDHGSQYTSIAFGERCDVLGVRPSRGTVGDCYDNALCESFFATLECELLDRRTFHSHAEARAAIFRFIVELTRFGGHLGQATFRISCSYCTGLRQPNDKCRRRRLYRTPKSLAVRPDLTPGLRRHERMSQVAIVGGGIIGSSWALVFARAGHDVRVYARHEEVRATLIDRVRTAAERSHAVASDVSVDETVRRITMATDLADALDGASWMQESLEERIEVKADLFARADRLAAPETILASSTSSIGASRFTENLRGRGRCIVAHPATPPHLIPAVEVVPAPWTTPGVVDRAFATMTAIGQVPVLVRREQPGFVLNRLQGALLIEMFRAITDGVMTPDDVDKLIRDGFGLRWAFLGPLEGVDLNAPGGIADYLSRYGFIFDQMVRERGGSSDVVTSELTAVLHAAMRDRLPLESLPDRIAWRDQRMADLRRLRQLKGPDSR
ncbi:MAG: L-carnitine dehydrogenase [Gemmatimonadaceae bacterium]|nr:L-carnitine dehydrogenase [Gemmatimonadaceae bacterium]